MNKPLLVAAPLLAALLSLSFLQSTGAQAGEKPDARPAAKAGPPMRWNGASIVSVQVKDLAAARSWYERVLGSRLVYELPDKSWAEVDLPVNGMLLGLQVRPEPKPSGGSAIGLGVENIEDAQAWLKEHQVDIEADLFEIPKTVKLLYFRDPDGNRFYFFQPYRGG